MSQPLKQFAKRRHRRIVMAGTLAALLMTVAAACSTLSTSVEPVLLREDATSVPAAAAAPDAADSSAHLVINEVHMSPEEGETDWVEFTVAGDGPVDLSLYEILDGNPEHPLGVLGDGTLLPGEFLVVSASADETVAEGPLIPFGLGKTDILTLFQDGEKVDAVSWRRDEVPEGATWGRLPDGGGEAGPLSPTPGEANREFVATEELPELFDESRVVEVRIELDADSWAAMLAGPHAEEYYSGSIAYDGVELDDVGVRLKGNSSLSGTARLGSSRYSFKVDMNRYVDGQTLLGVKKLNFNNGWNDPTYMREYLTFAVMNEFGLTAPQASFVDLYVAGEHLGLYLVVETVDGEFVEDHFEDDSGDLYKPKGPTGSLVYLGDTVASYGGLDVQTNEETTDHSAFLRFVDALNNGTAEELETVLDVDGALRYIAANAALVNLDSYLGTSHNYYLYEQDGVFTVIPWDANQSFGNFNCGCTAEGITGFMIDEPTCGPVASNPLVARLLAVPEYLGRYHNFLAEFIAGPFEPASMTARIEATADLIRPYVEAQELVFFSPDTFNESIQSSSTGALGQTVAMKPFVQQRVESIQGQLDGSISSTGSGEGSCPGGFGGLPGGPRPGGDQPLGPPPNGAPRPNGAPVPGRGKGPPGPQPGVALQ